jgi:hypothetical protein
MGSSSAIIIGLLAVEQFGPNFQYPPLMHNKLPLPSETASAGARLSWAAVLGLLTACAGCGNVGIGSIGGTSTAGTCDTDKLPSTDPCFQKSCCDSVTVGPDGGVIEDAGASAGPGVTTRLCGACNG